MSKYDKETRTIVHEGQAKVNKHYDTLRGDVVVLKLAITGLQNIFRGAGVGFIILSVLIALSDALLKIPITQEFIRLSPSIGITQFFAMAFFFITGVVFVIIGSAGRIRR